MNVLEFSNGHCSQQVTVNCLKHALVHNTHTHTHPFNGPLSGTTRVSQYQKGQPIWILLKQETVKGSGITWAVCKSAPCSRQITTPAPHNSVFLQAGCPSCRSTNSVKALQAQQSYGTGDNNHKKLSYRRVTARCVLSVVILPVATQQCRNYLYDKS